MNGYCVLFGWICFVWSRCCETTCRGWSHPYVPLGHVSCEDGPKTYAYVFGLELPLHAKTMCPKRMNLKSYADVFGLKLPLHAKAMCPKRMNLKS